MQELKLGQKVRDVITDNEGIIYGLAKYLADCHQALVIPKGGTNGDEGGKWYHIARLEVVKDKPLELPRLEIGSEVFHQSLESPKEVTSPPKSEEMEKGPAGLTIWPEGKKVPEGYVRDPISGELVPPGYIIHPEKRKLKEIPWGYHRVSANEYKYTSSSGGADTYGAPTK